jgi:hypothetical protein
MFLCCSPSFGSETQDAQSNMSRDMRIQYVLTCTQTDIMEHAVLYIYARCLLLSVIYSAQSYRI